MHPNNPDGRLSTDAISARDLTVIDESFCDTTPAASLVPQIGDTNTLVLKSFGKFWGLAGLRLGFAIGPASLINPLRDRIGPWAVAGPALELGAIALRDAAWAERTRARLVADSVRLDACLQTSNAIPLGGTPLFRLFEVNDAKEWQQRLAQAHVWSRIFPYSKTWQRLGLPHPDRWSHLETAL